MNAHMMHTAQGAASVIPQRFRKPDPAPPGPKQPGRFRLARLCQVSGVDAATIENWTNRRIWDRPTERTHRRFDFWDCLHLAIISKMRSLGMQLSGRGAILSESLLACAKAYVRWDGDLNSLPDRIALYALDDEKEWMMDWNTPPALLPSSYVVFNLRAIVEEVNQRYHAP